MIVAKYKFDKSIYENFIPVFNDGYNGYSISDEIDSENENYVIRTIEYDSLPTLMRFGRVWVDGETSTDSRTDSLLEVLDMNTSGLTSCNSMFRFNKSLTSISCEWDTKNVTDMRVMFYGCNNLTSLDVSNFDTSNVTDMYAMFTYCSNLTSIDVSNFDTRNVTTMQNMFHSCNNLTSLDLSNFDTSNVINMSNMFNHCYNLTSLDLSNFDTSKVTTMRSMFNGCTNLTSLDVSNFNTSNVTDMGYMFHSCQSVTSLDVSNFNTSKVTDMGSMFQNCNNLTELYVSNFDTENVTSMYAMFQNCYKLASLDLSNFNTSKVPNMSSMFHNCKSLTSLDVSNFDTSNTTNTSNMFTDALSLQYIRCNNTSTINTLAPLLYNRTSSTQGKLITTSSTNVDTTTLSSLNWSLDTSSGTKIAEYVYDKSIWNYLVPEFNEGYSGYFCNDRIEDEVNSPNVVTRELVGYGGLPTLMRFGYNAPETDDMNLIGKYQALKSVSYVNATEITDMSKMFMYCSRMTDVTFDNMNKNTTTHSMFLGCTYLNTINNLVINNKTTEMYGMFLYCHGLTELDASTWDVSNVINMADMFFYCTKLTTVGGISNWNTGKVTTMSRMFEWCENLATLDLSNWNTKNVTNMSEIFRACKKLTSINLSNWNTSNVTNMNSMFNGCNKLISLDVGNWDTSNVTRMEYMFYCCQTLTELDLSNWNTSKVTYLYTIFADCINLTSLNLSNWNVSNIKDLRYLITNCKKLKTLDISNWNFNSSISFTSNFEETPLLTDIGMLYCSQNTINKLIPLMTDGSKTIWVKDTKASYYTATDYVTFKDYKEDNRTLYLNSPLLEGDEIVNKEGKLYHYHKMGKVVLDGSKILFTVIGEAYQPTNTNFINFHYLNNNIKIRGEVYSDNFKHVFFGVSSDANTNCIWTHGSNNSIRLCIDKSKLQTTDENGLKQWLQANPTTVVYELAEPYYELISDDPLIVQSYTEGKLDTSSIITPTSIQSVPYEEELTYLYTSTQYCIQFYSTADCTVDIILGGTKVENKSVSVGLNKIYITTPSTLVDNKLIINAKGNATISKVVVVNSNAEFDYFDGLKSSFEDCLVTDVDNENYGKYEVGVKIVGKNKFDIATMCLGTISTGDGKLQSSDLRYRSDYISVKPNTIYTFKQKYNELTNIDATVYFTEYDINKNPILFTDGRKNPALLMTNTGAYGILNQPFTFTTRANTHYIMFRTQDNRDITTSTFQIEEGTTTTSYEPYKETNATIYLNSPLLKGDKIEVVDGKLCHYHKMRSIVLNGSEDEKWHEFVIEPGGLGRMMLELNNMYSLKFCNNLSIINWTNSWNTTSNAITLTPLNNNKSFIVPYINVKSIDAFKQWLSENPTTVVYELAEPYYEDITPIQSSFVISTVSEGDMEIITSLPIKSNITYLTNITSAVLMEQQLDELDNSTESLTNIVEDEINE